MKEQNMSEPCKEAVQTYRYLFEVMHIAGLTREQRIEAIDAACRAYAKPAVEALERLSSTEAFKFSFILGNRMVDHELQAHKDFARTALAHYKETA